jgi:hypothetical protein
VRVYESVRISRAEVYAHGYVHACADVCVQTCHGRAHELESGKAARDQVKRQWSNVSAAVKADVLKRLQTMHKIQDVHQVAVAAMLEQWAPDGIDGMEDKPVTYYFGKGTMLRYSGSYSKIDCPEVEEVLQNHKESWDDMSLTEQQREIDRIVSLLKARPEVTQLWADFKEFAAKLVAEARMQRHTIGMELFTEKSFGKGTLGDLWKVRCPTQKSSMENSVISFGFGFDYYIVKNPNKARHPKLALYAVITI